VSVRLHLGRLCRAVVTCALALSGAGCGTASTSAEPTRTSGEARDDHRAGQDGLAEGASASAPAHAPHADGTSAGGTTGTSAAAPACVGHAPPVEVGRVDDARLTEISGLAASRTQPGVLYANNDSGEPYARFFALRATGEVLAEIRLADHDAEDLEELALGPGPDGRDAVYLADIGDNEAREGRRPRASIHVLRVPEPEIASTPRSEALVLTHVERFALRYPDRPVDAEAFFVDPAQGDLYLLGKVSYGPAPLFVARAPLSSEHANLLVLLGEILPAGDLGDAITASSLDVSGARLAVRTYRDLFLFVRAPGEPWLETLSHPVRLPRLHERQGEAIAFTPEGAILSITEGEHAPVWLLAPCP
jgi:hypothetical protein